jgi:hypothetical protein
MVHLKECTDRRLDEKVEEIRRRMEEDARIQSDSDGEEAVDDLAEEMRRMTNGE